MYAIFHGTGDELTKYFAGITAAVLATDLSCQDRVISSGILKLIDLTFANISPEVHKQNLLTQFDCRFSTYPPMCIPKNTKSMNNSLHFVNKPDLFLSKITKLLFSKEPAAPATHTAGALVLAVEGYGLKDLGWTPEQIRTKFEVNNCLQSLKRIVCLSESQVARNHAICALKLCGEDIPKRLVRAVSYWDREDVKTWINLMGFGDYIEGFHTSYVDGQALLKLTEDQLEHDCLLKNSIHRERFIKELADLKNNFATYPTENSNIIANFLYSIETDYVQYTQNMVEAGIDKKFLPNLEDYNLLEDCKIMNGVHRKKILMAAAESINVSHYEQRPINKNQYSIENNSEIWISCNASGLGAAAMAEVLNKGPKRAWKEPEKCHKILITLGLSIRFCASFSNLFLKTCDFFVGSKIFTNKVDIFYNCKIVNQSLVIHFPRLPQMFLSFQVHQIINLRPLKTFES